MAKCDCKQVKKAYGVLTMLNKILLRSLVLMGITGLLGASNAALAAYSDPLTNTATVSGPSGTTDPTSGNNSATDSDLPNAIDIVVTKTPATGSYVPGSATAISYTLTVINNGPIDATDLNISDVFPAGVTASWTCAGTDCPAASGSGNIAYPDMTLSSGETVTFTVTANISASFTGNGSTCTNASDLENTFSATVEQTTDTNGNASTADAVDFAPYEEDTTDNSATSCLTQSLESDLAAYKDDGLDYYTPGQTSTYTIRGWNLGPSDTTALTLTDVIPLGADPQSVSCNLVDTEASTSTTLTPSSTPTNPGDSLIVSSAVDAHSSAGSNTWDGSGTPDFSTTFPDQYVECNVTVLFDTVSANY
jgi:uncharacterized repeat protein (TIGR01451 family)